MATAPGPSQEQAARMSRQGPLDTNDPRYKLLKATQVQGYDQKVMEEHQRLVEPHVESFNYFLTEGIERVTESVEPVEVSHPQTGQSMRFWWTDLRVERPTRDEGVTRVGIRKLMPRDCREAGTTYKGNLVATFNWQDDDGTEQSVEKKLGGMPIMVRSRACWLADMSRGELVAAREESNEMGGYFICNGIERIIRCLVLQRRHYIMALRRGAYHKRGANYTDAATLIRCVRPDQHSATVRCHYLTDGTVNFAFTMRRAEYFIPAGVLLKCFLEVSDRELYGKLVAGAAPGSGAAAFLAERAELLLRQADRPELRTKTQCIEYLGRHFRVVLNQPLTATDFEVGEALLRDYVFIHLDPARPADKLALLLAMLHKLYALVAGAAADDNPDALTHHEILLPGHLLLKFLKERLEDALGVAKGLITKDINAKPETDFSSETYVNNLLKKLPDVGQKFEYLLNTGNLITKSGLDLSQTSGFTVVAEKLNFFRYLSHFRSVHRGAYFAELRTTTVRKLLPESWGFMCPVHTPDGAPCGLLNHFTAACRIVTQGSAEPEAVDISMLQVLAGLGMLPSAPALTPPPPPDYLPIMLDGRLVGHVRSGATAGALVARLREIKSLALQALETNTDPEELGLSADEQQVPYHLEVVHIPPLMGGPYPGIFLFTQSARMIRPVVQLDSGRREMLGSLEQCFMAIQCPDGGHGGSPGLAYTHRELSASAMLSVVASLTPYSDFNQSPRNMYQCQMAKQTMGTPGQALPHRTDTKMYRLQTPQAPICRTVRYAEYKMDEFPNGTNAIVAVLAYTGYDMEDAMILNKSSMERGLCHGSLYKMETVDLRDERGAKMVFAAEPHDKRSMEALAHRTRPVGAFGQRYPQNIPASTSSPSVDPKRAVQGAGADGTGGRLPVLVPEPNNKDGDRIEADGLPAVGSIIWPGQVYYSTRDENTGKYKAHKLKGEEVAVVDQVTLIGVSANSGKGARGRGGGGGAGGGGGEMAVRANIRLLFNRNPVIGDKFASRHGQKGVLSILWPDVDMPFCAATGIRPDLIINPHAFPSRMTIGMLVESLVSKGGALAGQFVDASPFQRSDGVEKGNPVERWGEYLERQGFSRYGQETMISGVTGQEMPCDIYIGPVYYQRLRHMVSDKFQVRSTGPINNLTRQPIKGRKFGGGIRFGEMERDSLLAHGAAYLLHDRLHACSDYHVADVCTCCGSLLAPLRRPAANADVTSGLLLGGGNNSGGKTVCPQCAPDSSATIERVAMPYVFRYLATELAAMNIKVELEIK
ncbi:hypothetical protein PLESTB_000364600 [Pleodorina starrii]|uniref:DNA-directed RNA polymerase subunit beta n=1 Tax=Pleodorina starrii TaxID=330485 RepID=A0A9W6BEG8_9CHLO|nr:hypothetical protein PLESTM_000030600 [Pleodorina starrii]GLC50305.1 hypothetical protein PLESTB_000364600 [Pleodorina starrii]GLC64311.1 hypothetical protein PLESTF_000148000 [Pleodorina starrii]